MYDGAETKPALHRLKRERIGNVYVFIRNRDVTVQKIFSSVCFWCKGFSSVHFRYSEGDQLRGGDYYSVICATDTSHVMYF